MKKEYVTPKMEITEFDTEDVIVTSPIDPTDPTKPPETPVTPVIP